MKNHIRVGLLGAFFFLLIGSASAQQSTAGKKMLLDIKPAPAAAAQSKIGEIPANGGYLWVNKSTQTAKLYKDGNLVLESVCGTGVAFTNKNTTHNGRHHILEKKGRDHVNKDGIPMPFAMKFTDDEECIHGNSSFVTSSGKGMPQSHGCVRFPVEVAKTIYDTMKEGDVVDVVGDEAEARKDLGVTELFKDKGDGTMMFRVADPRHTAAEAQVARKFWVDKRLFVSPRGETDPRRIKVCLPCMPDGSRMPFLDFQRAILTPEELAGGVRLTIDHAKVR